MTHSHHKCKPRRTLLVKVVVTDEELRSRLAVKNHQRIKDLPSDPRSIAEDDWKTDLTAWPAVDLGKIYSFILSKKEFHSHYVGKYKLCKAYSYFASGFVGTVYSYTFDAACRCVLKCNECKVQRFKVQVSTNER